MSLDETTKQQLEQLARGMLKEKQLSVPFDDLGILVLKNSDEFEKRKDKVVAFGEVVVDSIQFVYFAA